MIVLEKLKILILYKTVVQDYFNVNFYITKANLNIPKYQIVSDIKMENNNFVCRRMSWDLGIVHHQFNGIVMLLFQL